MDKQLVLKPHLSEKTYGLSNTRVYAFEVPRGVNKHAIARAIAAQFDVVVSEVNVMNVVGKAKRTISQGGRRVANGREAATRKAYVTLAEGNSLPFFAAVEEAEAKEEKVQEKIDKSAAKEAKKAEKPTRRGLRRNSKAEETK